MKAIVFTAAMPMAGPAFAEGTTHRAGIHVGENYLAGIRMALNNAQKIAACHESVDDEVAIEAVAHGPGLDMYIPGKGQVENRIAVLSPEKDHISFAACGNMLQKMREVAGAEGQLMSEATVVPSGLVRLIELQEQGYAHVRP